MGRIASSAGVACTLNQEILPGGSRKDVWWTPDGVQWACANADAPFGPRYGAAVAASGGKLWLMGGATQEKSTPPEKHYPKMAPDG